MTKKKKKNMRKLDEKKNLKAAKKASSRGDSS